MEIIQNIWISLIGENTPLFTICSVIFSSIEIYLYSLIISALLNINITYKRRIIFIIFLVAIGYLSSKFIISPYYTFINWLFTILLSVITFKTSLVKSICATICFYFVTFFVNIIWLITYTTLFDCTSVHMQQVLLYRIILSVSVNISYYIFYKFCKKHPLNINFLDKLKTHTVLIFNIFLGLITVSVQLLIAYLYFDYIPISLNIFSSIILLAYFLISIFSLYRTNKLEITTQLLEKEKLYNIHLSTLHDNIRGFKHDFNNIIQALGGYISTNNMNGLKIYYKDLLEDCQINNNLGVLNPEIINHPAIYSLLSDKYDKAEELEVKVNLEILDDLSCLNMKAYELVRILGILLDNAIEASADSKEKIINVIFRKDKKVNRNLIIIENSYENKNININKIFEKGYSSKNTEDERNHGLGLWEVKKYLKKRKNLNLHTTKNNDYFIQQFEIYN